MSGGRVRIGVSACLLGAPVRYDGGHKLQSFLMGELDALVEWVPVCPEVEVGMAVPRETLRLAPGPGGRTLMLGNASNEDWTSRMEAFAAARVRALAELRISGYVLKSRSPSCGLATPDGTGLFAAELLRQLPRLPVEEETALADASRRAEFLARARAYRTI